MQSIGKGASVNICIQQIKNIAPNIHGIEGMGIDLGLHTRPRMGARYERQVQALGIGVGSTKGR